MSQRILEPVQKQVFFSNCTCIYFRIYFHEQNESLPNIMFVLELKANQCKVKIDEKCLTNLVNLLLGEALAPVLGAANLQQVKVVTVVTTQSPPPRRCHSP